MLTFCIPLETVERMVLESKVDKIQDGPRAWPFPQSGFDEPRTIGIRPKALCLFFEADVAVWKHMLEDDTSSRPFSSMACASSSHSATLIGSGRGRRMDICRWVIELRSHPTVVLPDQGSGSGEGSIGRHSGSVCLPDKPGLSARLVHGFLPCLWPKARLPAFESRSSADVLAELLNLSSK